MAGEDGLALLGETMMIDELELMEKLKELKEELELLLLTLGEGLLFLFTVALEALTRDLLDHKTWLLA